MKEFKLDDTVSANSTNSDGKNLPTKVGFWEKAKSVLLKEVDLKGILLKEIDVKGFLLKEIDVKGFLLQEIDLNKPIKLSPKTEKVFGEIHDFLFQEVKFPELHSFLFQEVNLFGNKKNDKEQT